MTLTMRDNSVFSNTTGSLFSKTFFAVTAIAILLFTVYIVFATDTDGDGTDDDADCARLDPNTRPLSNKTFNLITTRINICPGIYYNTTLIVNETSNTSNTSLPLVINCTESNSSNNLTFRFDTGGGASNDALRNWLLIENVTNGRVNVTGCRIDGTGYNDTVLTAGSSSAQNTTMAWGQSNETLAINISNSSNIIISGLKVTNLAFGAIVIDGAASTNITVMDSGFENITRNTSLTHVEGRANPMDIMWIIKGSNISFLNNNITVSPDAITVGTSNGGTIAVQGPTTTRRAGFNISARGVVLQENVMILHTTSACVKTNSSDHYIVNNTCAGNASYGYFFKSSKNVTFLDNNASYSNDSLNYTEARAGVYIDDGFNFTITNLLVDIHSGTALYLNSTQRVVVTTSTLNQTFRGVVLNNSDNNRFTSNNIRAINDSFLTVVNGSDNLTLNLNKYWNSSYNGLQFWNATELRMTNEWVKNFTNVGLKLDAKTSGAIITNVSLNSSNHSAYDYMMNLSDNITLDGFNSTRTTGTAVIVINSSAVNLSHFNIINASRNGITIWNSTGVFSNKYVDGNYTINNINGSTYLAINVTNLSSHVNLSNLVIGTSNHTSYSSVHVDGIMVNYSNNISFHNVSIRNVSRAAFIYGNTTGLSVIGYCNVSLHSDQDTFGLLASGNSSVSTFACGKLTNVTMTDVQLVVGTSTGSQVRFNDPINITGASFFDSYVNFSSPDTLYVNMTGLNATGANRAANVTLTGMGYEADGVLVDYDDDGVFQACAANCTLTSTGSVLSFNVSHFSTYQASPRVSARTVGGGGGGGGGRGGGFKTIIPTATGVTVQLTNYDAARIQIGTEAYAFSLTRAYRDAVDIKVAQKDYKLALGRAGSVDLNKDGTPDVTLSLVSVIHNLATFVVKLGAAPVVAPESAPEVPSTAPSEPFAAPAAAEAAAPYEASAPAEEADVEVPVAAPARKKLGPGTMLTVIVAVIVALLLVMHFRKKKSAF